MLVNQIILYLILLFAGFSIARLLAKFVRRLTQDFQIPDIGRGLSIVIEYSIYVTVILFILTDIGIQNIVFNLVVWFLLTLLLINTVAYCLNNIQNIITRPKTKFGKQKLTHVVVKLRKHEKLLVPNKIIGSTFPTEKLNPKSQPES